MKIKQIKLPIVVSVPHGGLKIPAYLQNKCLLTDKEILLDSDTWSRELFNFTDLVEEYIDTDIARIVVDMNRHENDLPPKNKDGVVKTLSVIGSRVWKGRRETGLSYNEIQHLLESYYFPYHRRIQKAASNPKVILGIDCHTMLDYGPSSKKEAWEQRPLFCISNRGGKDGHQRLDDAITAPPAIMQRFKDLLEKKFALYPEAVEEVAIVSINEPFMGGFITKHHGSIGQIPWIQLEVNRRLYLPNEVNDLTVMTKDTSGMLEKLCGDLYEVIRELVSEMMPTGDDTNKAV